MLSFFQLGILCALVYRRHRAYSYPIGDKKNEKPKKLPINILIASWLGMAAWPSGPALAQATGLPAEVAARQAADAGLQTLITTLQGQVSVLQTQVDNVPKLTAHKIGDQYAGGIIFHVTEDGQHVLIAALYDQDGGAGMQWYNGVYKVTGATFDGMGAGAMNTAIIIAAQTIDNPAGNYAAKLAAEYTARDDGLACTGVSTETCYGDWYLPSRHELNLLYQQDAFVGGFTDGNYWSSTEHGANLARSRHFHSDIQFAFTKGIPFRVRAIRAF
jgi:hypothetical protein